MIVAVVIALVVAYAVMTEFVAQTYLVPSEGMRPSIHPGERVVVDKLAYRFHAPQPGEVIIFDAPKGWIPNRPKGAFDLVKRVIAVGGQTVQCRESTGLTVNGKALLEPYAAKDDTGVCRGFEFGPVTVPDGRLWVMGDDRTHSADSRAHCVRPAQSVWCTGDQPDASVPVANVVGRVAYIYTPPVGFRDIPSGNPQR
ncbi:signal peptidase I [Mycobacteroides sp. CBMA 271]|uniref:signal peptidase I n=1 Tax=Mycobacteroides sp. CBMA 271 TaxID=2606608 RepID=UPI0028BEBD57|nr:signal peptidase I [Mycobacteroides sp. CBMA 271]